MMLVSELERSGVRDRTLVISFSFPRLMAVQAVAPDVPTGWITLRSAWPRDDVRFLGPHWPLLLINPLYVFLAHYRGQSVCPLDPSPDPRLWLYRLLGCDAVLTDDPLKTCTALKRSRPAVNIG
jgi:glycerophosphoryl diester phosphodiesterase